MKLETSPSLLGVLGVVHGFCARTGGVSVGHCASLNCSFKVHDNDEAVVENRRRAKNCLGMPEEKLMIPNQVHGNQALVIDKQDPQQVALSDADALITAEARVILGVTYADCVPIVLSSPMGEVVAVIHAGWRGLRASVINNTVQSMKDAYVAPSIAAIGPAISPKGFVVNGEVLDYFMTHWSSQVKNHGSFGHVDLRAIAARQLKDSGVLTVDFVGGYTDLDAHSYFSHRRDGGATGRHLALIAKR